MKNTDIILNFANGGGITSISDDQCYYEGCPTCDYGSEYINTMDIEFIQLGTLHIQLNQSYEYAVSQGDIMKLLLKNINRILTMTERQFVDWIFEFFKKTEALEEFKINDESLLGNV